MFRVLFAPATFAVLLTGCEPAASETHHEHTGSMEATLFRPDGIEWRDGPDSLPPGAQMAVLEGDPAREGPFVFRAKLPDGYRIPPHTHPKIERITVIEGTFHLGMGEVFDESLGRPMPKGTYGYWPAGMIHFAFTKDETIIQLHGEGPWTINYLNPADDPRNTAE